MQIMIACAKLMNSEVDAPKVKTTLPQFQNEADSIIEQLAGYSSDELQSVLHVNRAIALENYTRFHNFHITETLRPAALLYDGMVFKKLDMSTFSSDEMEYANSKLNICSFLYGLLRPLDLINPYRLEGSVTLPGNNGMTMFDYWKPRLTDHLIERVKSDSGILINLASDEMRNLFDWRRVNSEVQVISPTFKVEKDGKLKNVTIYAKMCRGAMTRFILKNRLINPEELKHFNYEGIHYTPSAGDWAFVL